MVEVLGLYKKKCEVMGVSAQLSLSRWKMDCMEEVRTSNISGTMPPIFFILSPGVWENNRLINKN